MLLLILICLLEVHYYYLLLPVNKVFKTFLRDLHPALHDSTTQFCFFFDDRTSLTWWHGVLSCWNKTSEDEYAVVIMRWKLSAIMLRYVVKPRSADAKGPKLIYKAWWIHGFMLFAANSDPPTRMWQQKSRLIRAGNIFLSFYCPIVVSTFAK